jgi:CheY-like chemotaxis protein
MLQGLRSGLRKRGLGIEKITTQSRLVDLLDAAAIDGCAPRLVILDLRLPWGDEVVLHHNALTGGLGCLDLLRQEPVTSHTPVIIYSAFVGDPFVGELLQPHQPITAIDKSEGTGRLIVVIDNIVGTLRPRRQQLRRVGELGELHVLRWAALVAGVGALGAALVSVLHRIF